MFGAPGFEEELRRRLKGRVLLLGIGNTLRGDDAAGPTLIALLEGTVGAILIDAGEVPENYFSRISQAGADTIVFMDAANFGGAAGDLAVLEADDIAGYSVSTHQMPMEVFFRAMRQQSRADVFGIGIQPAGIGFGDPMSPDVAESVNALARLLRGFLPPV